MANWGAALKSVGDNLGKQIDYNMAESERRSRESREDNILAQQARFRTRELEHKESDLIFRQDLAETKETNRANEADLLAGYRAEDLRIKGEAAASAASNRAAGLENANKRLDADARKEAIRGIREQLKVLTTRVDSKYEFDTENPEYQKELDTLEEWRVYQEAQTDWSPNQQTIAYEMGRQNAANIDIMQAVKDAPDNVVEAMLYIVQQDGYKKASASGDTNPAKVRGLAEKMVGAPSVGKEEEEAAPDDTLIPMDGGIPMPEDKSTGVGVPTGQSGGSGAASSSSDSLDPDLIFGTADLLDKKPTDWDAPPPRQPSVAASKPSLDYGQKAPQKAQEQMPQSYRDFLYEAKTYVAQKDPSQKIGGKGIKLNAPADFGKQEVIQFLTENGMKAADVKVILRRMGFYDEKQKKKK